MPRVWVMRGLGRSPERSRAVLPGPGGASPSVWVGHLCIFLGQQGLGLAALRLCRRGPQAFQGGSGRSEHTHAEGRRVGT